MPPAAQTHDSSPLAPPEPRTPFLLLLLLILILILLLLIPALPPLPWRRWGRPAGDVDLDEPASPNAAEAIAANNLATVLKLQGEVTVEAG